MGTARRQSTFALAGCGILFCAACVGTGGSKAPRPEHHGTLGVVPSSTTTAGSATTAAPAVGVTAPSSAVSHAVAGALTPHTSSPACSPSSCVRVPTAVSPAFARSAKPEDGQWRPYPGLSSSDEPALWVTTIHPHPQSVFVTATVVAVDLRRYHLEWVVGSADEGGEKLAAHMALGLIQPAALNEAIALFNGGFQARHGRWGQLSHGITLVEPKPVGCGVGLDRQGGVRVGTPADVEPMGELLTYRQTPPCLVSRGEIHPALTSGRDGVWAGKSDREKTRRRSALGIDQETGWLYYVVGVEASPLDLARAFVSLHCDAALQLDINWNWTRFFLVDQASGSPEIHSPLLEGMVKDAGEYVQRPSKRDFFVVRRKTD